MSYDFTFFADHASKCRRMLGSVATVELALTKFFHSVAKAEETVKSISRDDGDLFFAAGAYFKGGANTSELEKSLSTELPEDFKHFYNQFGEAVIVTRSEPVSIMPLKSIIEEFESDPDIEVDEGRFFRFANFQHPFCLGLRRDDKTDQWQVVASTNGLLYSEMVGPQGRQTVVASSFYSWLKHLIKTDGYPDHIFPRDPDVPYLTVVAEEN